MAYRTVVDHPGVERWDRDRFEYERDRDRRHDVRERSRERRRVIYDDDDDDSSIGRGPRPFHRRRSSPSPPPRWARRISPPPREEVERSRLVIEKERFRSPSPSPPRRPAARLVRRQSSLDTFDRKPARRYWEREEEREEYGPPARRDDHRLPPYVDMPEPRARPLPPVRRPGERDELRVAGRFRYGEDDHQYVYPEKVRETEIIRSRRRARSRDSWGTSRRGRSRSSSSTSSSSTSSKSRSTVRTSKSEYPKKGKTRIPARLVSKRALIELGYPYVEEGSVVIVQMALGQKNIDDLLKLSDEYKKSDLEIIAARSSSEDIIEERCERRIEIYEGAAALPPPVQPAHYGGTQIVTKPSSKDGPVVIEVNPPPEYQKPPAEKVKTTVIRDVHDVRDVSPSRYTTTSYDTSTSYDTYTTSTTSSPTTVVAREVSNNIPIGPMALARRRSRSRRRSKSRHRDAYETEELRSEIRHLEKQLARRERSRHSRSRHRSRSRGAELVRAERLSTGELVLFEEEVERIQEPRGSGPRIEKDKRGRLSISVPKYR